jgi:hypothetical protein
VRFIGHSRTASPSVGNLLHVTLPAPRICKWWTPVDCAWVWGLAVPSHLGLINRPFVPHIKSWEPCSCSKAPDGPQAYTFNVLGLQKEGAQMRESEWGQGLTATKNVSRGFLFQSTAPTQWTVQQPWQMNVSCKQTSDHPGLGPIKVQKFSLGTQAGSRD